ncbi:MAG: undecaprenyl-phosphate glucose phosphotransferase [Rhodovibrionaceae bacterium]
MARRSVRHASEAESLLATLLRLGDVLVIAVTGLLCYALREELHELTSSYAVALFLCAFFALNLLQLAGVYRPEILRSPIREVARTAAAWVVTLFLVVALAALTKTTAHYSRIWFVLWALTGLGGLLMLRVAASIYLSRLRRGGYGMKRLAIFGAGEMAEHLTAQLRGNAEGVELVGYFTPSHSEAQMAEAPYLGGLAQLSERLRLERIDELMVALPWNDAKLIPQIMEAVRGLSLSVRLCPPAAPLDIPVRDVSIFAGVPMVEVWHRPLSERDLFIKAVEDKVFSALLLLLLSPLMLAIAVAIKLDSRGPVLFRQKRAGFNNDSFEVLKFRTMYNGTDPEGEVPQACRNDERVTRVGAFLRRTSFDELPQLLNVLRGEMSLVGPRPHAVEHGTLYSELIEEYLARQRVRPGITGWAQINGLRGATETPEKMRQRVEYDLWYIDNWSVSLDLRILFLTPFTGLVSENAY